MATAKCNGNSAAVLVPAVAYVRMSSDKQEASPAQQRAEISKYAERSGYAVLRMYEDDGVSGWKDTREAFQRMIDDAEKRKDFRAVVVWDQNRFSRFLPVEACYYWHRLDKANVHLASVNQGRIEWTSIAGFLTATIRQHADSEHRHKLSRDVKRGLRAIAEQGLWLGRVPTGYHLVDRRLVPNDKAPIVVGMFRDYLAGASLRHVAKELNVAGIQTTQGGLWGPGPVQRMLSNVVYLGVRRFHEVEIPNNHPALIDRETFDAVQRLLGERKGTTTPHEDGGRFLFTSLLRCGCCGSQMCGRHDYGDSPKYHCRGHAEYGNCTRNTVHQDELVGYVVDTIEAHWMNPKTVQRLREALRELVDAERPKQDAKQIEGQLTTLDTKLAKAKRRLVEVDVDMLPIVREQIRELRSQHDQLEAALRAAGTPKAALYAEADERIDRAVSAFSALRGVLESAAMPQRREVLRQTVDKVEVWTTKEQIGRQFRFLLDKGRIHLREQEQLVAQTRD